MALRLVAACRRRLTNLGRAGSWFRGSRIARWTPPFRSILTRCAGTAECSSWVRAAAVARAVVEIRPADEPYRPDR